MGRKKIQIQHIKEDRSRQVTFLKRRNGLMKKAYELSVLCDCEVALVIVTSTNKTIQYSSSDFDAILHRFKQKGVPNEIKCNQDFIKDNSLSKSDDEHLSQTSTNRGSLEPEQGLQFISIHQAEIKQEKEEKEAMLRQRQKQHQYHPQGQEKEENNKYKNKNNSDENDNDNDKHKNLVNSARLLPVYPTLDSNMNDTHKKDTSSGQVVTYNHLQNSGYNHIAFQPHLPNQQQQEIQVTNNKQLGLVYSQSTISQEQGDCFYPNTLIQDDIASLYNQTPVRTPPASFASTSDFDTLSTDHLLNLAEEPRTLNKKSPNLTIGLSVTQELFKQQQQQQQQQQCLNNTIFPLSTVTTPMNYYDTNSMYFMNPVLGGEKRKVEEDDGEFNSVKLFQMPSSSLTFNSFEKQGPDEFHDSLKNKHTTLALFDNLTNKKIKIET